MSKIDSSVTSLYASIGITTSSIETRAKIVKKASVEAPKLQKEPKRPNISKLFEPYIAITLCHKTKKGILVDFIGLHWNYYF